MKHGGKMNLARSTFFFLYNPITESKQIKTFEKLFSNIKLLNLDELSQIVCVVAF